MKCDGTYRRVPECIPSVFRHATTPAGRKRDRGEKEGCEAYDAIFSS